MIIFSRTIIMFLFLSIISIINLQAQGAENTNFYTPNAQDPLYKIYMKYDYFSDYLVSSDFNTQEATGLEYRYQTMGKGQAPEGGWKSRFVADVGILTPQGEFNTNYLTQWSPLPNTGGYGTSAGTGTGVGGYGTSGSYGSVEDIYGRYASMDEYLASPDFQPELANALEYRYRTRGKGPEPAGGWRTAFSDNTYTPGFSVGPNAGIPWGQPGTGMVRGNGSTMIDPNINRWPQGSPVNPVSNTGNQALKEFIKATAELQAKLQTPQTDYNYTGDSPQRKQLINDLSGISRQLDQVRNLQGQGGEYSTSAGTGTGGVVNTNFYTPNAQDPLNKYYEKYPSFDAYRQSTDFNTQEATGLEYRYQTTGKGPVPEGGWKSRFVADVGILTPQGGFNTNYLTQWSPLPNTGGNSATN
ncbi:MAG: hypothetical protein KKD79_08440 [Candidatus Omnitrophica bacterium]|nr:hypothetical protein [Candidatus Omnitrophota bacterium]